MTNPKPSGVRRGRYAAVRLISLIALSAFAVLPMSAQEKAAPRPEMAVYQMGLLTRGPGWTAESTTETERVQAEHMKHIQKMAADGKLVGAGPITDGGQLRGIFIFAVPSLEEAKALAGADPAVKAGRLAVEVHPWFGPKGIGAKYFAQRKANPEAKVEMETYQLALLRRGPKATAESTPESAKMQADHLANIFKMIESGKLGAAGPFTDGGDVVGIFVFRVGSLEEAKALAETDPLVKAGKMIVELHPWMAAKGVLP
jgi:uncharacterized protein YciI